MGIGRAGWLVNKGIVHARFHSAGAIETATIVAELWWRAMWWIPAYWKSGAQDACL